MVRVPLVVVRSAGMLAEVARRWEGEADVCPFPVYYDRRHPSRRGVVSVVAGACVDKRATVE